MHTKFTDTKSFSSESHHSFLNLYFKLVQLKNLYRQGWFRIGIEKERIETVADHSFLVALMSYLTAKEYHPELDAEKVLLLALFHDVGEAITGDHTPTTKLSKEERKRKEREGFISIFEDTKHKDGYLALWDEMHALKTPESQFVHEIDGLEMGLQSQLYRLLGQEEFDGIDKSAEERLLSECNKDIFKSAQAAS